MAICAFSVVRCDTPEAQALYKETAGSVENRKHAAAMRKAGVLGVQTEGRSSKKWRRQIHQLRGNQD